MPGHQKANILRGSEQNEGSYTVSQIIIFSSYTTVQYLSEGNVVLSFFDSSTSNKKLQQKLLKKLF